MKNITKIVFVFSFLIFVLPAVLSAQNKNDEKKNVEKSSKLVVFDASQSYSLQNSTQIFKEVLNPSPQTSFTTLKQEQDPLGFTHQKMQQYFKGIKVEFATVMLSSKDGMVQTLSSGYSPIANDFGISASISRSQALNRAIAHVGATKYMWENPAEAAMADNYKKPTGELIIFPATENVSETNRLAYKFDIYATAPLYRADVYIDANTGQVILENKKIHHANVPATGSSLYNGNVSFTASNSGSQYRLRQSADGGGIETYDMNNGTNYNNASDVTSNSTNFTSNNTGVQAHYGAERTHKYFQQKHNRNSYNNAGAVIRSYVSYSSNYVNAFWDGSRMTYGDGDGVNYGPLVSLDICGHEIAHGVTTYSANLVYSYESGALNESFSDIFGESIEKFATGTNDWLMGDQIGAGGSGGALRSMKNPNTYSNPDTYKGSYWYAGSGDSGGVHTNSGVQNFWFYILTVGKSGTNDKGNSYNVSSIGMDKAAAIAYRNLTVYLGANSNYNDARNGAIQSAKDLYGADSAEEIATTNAWYAVGVGAAYSGGGGGGSEYCTSKGNNVNDEYIGRVQLNTINNASGAQQYSDYTNISTSLSEGATYTVTVTPTWTGSKYNEGIAVWIDYNGDKDFTDAGELVFSKSASTSSPVSGSFTVPSGTIGGATRMRVAMKYNGIPTSCETFSYGEVEDYTINLGGGGTDTQAPSTPSSLVASALTQTSVTLSWNASTDNVGVTGYDIFQGSTNLGTVTGTSANVTGLSASTSYSFKVRAKDAAGNNSSYSNTVNVTTPGSSVSYCTSKGNNSNSEWIDYVKLNNLTKSSGNDGGYKDNTNLTANLPYGSNSIQFSAGFGGSSYKEFWRIWIDYNQNGTFESNEMLVSGTSSSSGTLSTSFNVPNSALAGPTRMRVSMKYNTSQTACETFSYGEVEDYTVIIGSGFAPQGVTQGSNLSSSEMTLYPNPVKHTLNIGLLDATGKDYVIYNVMGQVVGKGAFAENVDVSALQSGVYMMEVTTQGEKLIKRFVKE